MRKLLTSMLTLTLVCGSLITTPVLAEDTSASTNSEPSSTVKSEEVAVTFMFMDGDNVRSIKSLMFAKGTHNYGYLESLVENLCHRLLITLDFSSHFNDRHLHNISLCPKFLSLCALGFDVPHRTYK